MTTGIVFDIKKFSLHDGPGIRTTIFLKGCPLSCQWCHNPESRSLKPERFYWENRCVRCGVCVEVCEQGAVTMENNQVVTDPDKCQLCGDCVEACYSEARQIVGSEMTVEAVMAEIERDRPFYEESNGGVTFSGGEPLNQADFLEEVLDHCRDLGIHTALDTCGYAPWETIDRLRARIDLFLYDLKLMDGDRHREFTRQGNDLILDNLRKLSEMGHAIHLRVPLIPEITDTDEQLQRLAGYAASLPNLERVDILPFHALATDKYQRLGLQHPMPPNRKHDAARITEVADIFRSFRLPVTTGG